MILINLSNKCLQAIYFPAEKGGGIELAILWKMELQYYGKIICNFYEKVLAKNSISDIIVLIDSDSKNTYKELSPIAYYNMSDC